ncbi:MAG: VCBS repeat-containing protein [Planctomycetota bacterium]
MHRNILTALIAAAATNAAAQACPAGADFAPPILIPTGNGPTSLSLGNFNNDGNIDLAVVNSNDGTVSTFTGNGDGTFSFEITINSGLPARLVSVVPVSNNPDPYDSILVEELNSLRNYRRTDAGFGDVEPCDAEGIVTGIDFGPLPNATVADTIIAIDKPTGPDEFLYINLALFPFESYCGSITSFRRPTTDQPSAIASADLNGDGQDENIIVAGRNDGVVWAHLFDTTFNFPATIYPVGPRPTAIEAEDVNEDGVDDLIVAFSDINAIRIFLGDGVGGLSLTPIELPYTTTTTAIPSSVIVADFNKDDEQDIMLATNSNPGVLYFRGNGTGSFAAPVPISADFDHTVFAADVNNDGATDLITSSGFGTSPANVVKVYLSNCLFCPADVNADGAVTPADFSAWILAFNLDLPECDQNGDGICTPADFTAWSLNYNDGC